MIKLFSRKNLTNLNIYQVLISIYGVGIYKTTLVCKFLGLIPLSPFSSIKTKQITNIIDWIENDFSKKHQIHNQLKNKQENIIINIKKTNSLRGIRLIKKLPVRGQRTRTNAKSCKK